MPYIFCTYITAIAEFKRCSSHLVAVILLACNSYVLLPLALSQFAQGCQIRRRKQVTLTVKSHQGQNSQFLPPALSACVFIKHSRCFFSWLRVVIVWELSFFQSKSTLVFVAFWKTFYDEKLFIINTDQGVISYKKCNVAQLPCFCCIEWLSIVMYFQYIQYSSVSRLLSHPFLYLLLG